MSTTEELPDLDEQITALVRRRRPRQRRDWVHGVKDLTVETTFCRRVIAKPEQPPLEIREVCHVEEIDCPTCRPLANDLVREREEEAKIAPEVRAMAHVEDILPFLPLLQTELLAIGFCCVDWAMDVVSRRGFYVVALRQKGSSIATPFWIRYRQGSHRPDRPGDEKVQLSWEQPLDLPPPITVTANARFIAFALWGRCTLG